MNICGVLVHCAPGTVDRISGELSAMAGVEIHLRAPDDRLVVTVEDTSDSVAGDAILAIHRVPGVISAALTYHHFEDADAASAAA